MMSPIDLCNADLTKAAFKNVMFFSWAEGGAMGEPGAIVFFVKSGEVYHLNYVYGDVDIKKVEKLFPTLAECRFEMFGINCTVPKGWNYVYLGMGNHLIVHDEVYSSFTEHISVDMEPYMVYRNWREVAEKLLNNV